MVGEVARGVILRYGTLYGPGTWFSPDDAVAEQVRNIDDVLRVVRTPAGSEVNRLGADELEALTLAGVGSA